jgi:ABC-2 type transport system permease protein
MKAYLTTARLSMQSCFAYRKAYALGTVASCLGLIASVALWRALLGGGQMGGFTLYEMKAYALVSFATNWLGNAIGEWTFANRIKDGQVAIDLVRPVSTQRLMFAQVVGGLPMEAMIIGVVAVGFAFLAGPIPPPHNPILLLISLLLVIPIRFTLGFLTALLVFWTQSFHGVAWARGAVSQVLSGSLVPLTLMPVWLRSTAAVLPFASLTSTPALIYLGKVDGVAALSLVGLQAFWSVALWFTAQLAFHGASRQVTIHGG